MSQSVRSVVCVLSLFITVTLVVGCSDSDDGVDSPSGTSNGDVDPDANEGAQGPEDFEDDPGAQSANERYVGYVLLTEEADSAEMLAVFLELPSGADGALTLNQLRPRGDSCQTRRLPVDSTGPIADLPVAIRNTVSAGEALVVSSLQGTYTELLRDSGLGFTLYVPDQQQLTQPVPDNLSLAIPGDEAIPAFDDVGIPDLAALTISDDSADTYGGSGTRVAWTPSEQAGSAVRLQIQGLDSSNDGEIVRVDCLLEDDGEFTVPPAVDEALPSDFSVPLDLRRELIRSETSGNTELLLVRRGPPSP